MQVCVHTLKKVLTAYLVGSEQEVGQQANGESLLQELPPKRDPRVSWRRSLHTWGKRQERQEYSES